MCIVFNCRNQQRREREAHIARSPDYANVHSSGNSPDPCARDVTPWNVDEKSPLSPGVAMSQKTNIDCALTLAVIDGDASSAGAKGGADGSGDSVYTRGSSAASSFNRPPPIKLDADDDNYNPQRHFRPIANALVAPGKFDDSSSASDESCFNTSNNNNSSALDSYEFAQFESYVTSPFHDDYDYDGGGGGLSFGNNTSADVTESCNGDDDANISSVSNVMYLSSNSSSLQTVSSCGESSDLKAEIDSIVKLIADQRFDRLPIDPTFNQPFAPPSSENNDNINLNSNNASCGDPPMMKSSPEVATPMMKSSPEAAVPMMKSPPEVVVASDGRRRGKGRGRALLEAIRAN